MVYGIYRWFITLTDSTATWTLILQHICMNLNKTTAIWFGLI